MLEAIVWLTLASILLIGVPGPSAMALAAIGASEGMRKGVPLASGLICGAMLTGLLSMFGMLTLLEQWPSARLALQVIGGLFILAVAVKMLRTPVADGRTNETHFGFRSGILFNVLNPKAYATFMILTTKFMPPIASKLMAILIIEVVVFAAAFFVALGWLAFGTLLKHLIHSPHGQLRLRTAFACLMVVFVVPLLFSLSPL